MIKTVSFLFLAPVLLRASVFGAGADLSQTVKAAAQKLAEQSGYRC
jgi:hypothetical protein